MNIVVTGGNGFLGSNIIQWCKNNGHNTLSIIRKSVLHTSILDFNPDVVIHCAWAGGNSNVDSNNTIQIDNIQMSISVLETANRLIKKPLFVGVGSFAEYGTLNERAEETMHETPTTLYGLTKNIVKNISHMYCNQNNIPWMWIRPCYIYGPGDVYTRLIPKVINSIKNKTPITLNSCETIIDYLYIDDFCRGIESLILSNLRGVYNICSGKEYKLRHIIKNIQEEMRDIDTVIIDDSKIESQYICGSNKKLISNTGWIPMISIKDGLKKTINYCEKY